MKNVSDISFLKLQCLVLKLYYFTRKEKGEKKEVDTKQDKGSTSLYTDHNRAFLETLILHETNLTAHKTTHL